MSASSMIIRRRPLERLVENQTTFSAAQTELHLFETHQRAEQISLTFSESVFVSMLEGKKVMHLDEKGDFDFLPGESIFLPENTLMNIDFPEARMDRPTRCLAMTIAPEKI